MGARFVLSQFVSRVCFTSLSHEFVSRVCLTNSFHKFVSQTRLSRISALLAGFCLTDSCLADSLLTDSLRLMAISQHISHVAVYTLVALAAQDAPQMAIAQSLRIDGPPVLAELAALAETPYAAADAYTPVAPPEVTAVGFREWATSAAEVVASVEFSAPQAIAAAPLPQPIAAIAPPEDLDPAIAPLAAQAAPLWQPLSAPLTAIAPPEILFDPWVDAEELSRLDEEWSQVQLQDVLWENS